MTKIAILGAGLCGLSVARTLHRRGVAVSVFEKSRGLGGRMSTKRCDWANLDLGAQYFTADSDAFAAQVEAWQRAGCVARWNFEPHTFRGERLQASPDDRRRFVGTPAMNSMCHQMAQGLDLHTRAHVVAASHDGKWTLRLDSGERAGGFDWLVSTLPAEQSRALLGPKAPLVADLPETVHTPCWAVGLSTRGTVDDRVQGIFGDDEVAWVARQSAKPGRQPPALADDTWIVHFTPGMTTRLGRECELADLTQRALAWLSRASGCALEGVDAYAHFWRYANIEPPSLERGYFADPDQRLALLGAWSAGGKVEGAYLAAQAFVEHYFQEPD